MNRLALALLIALSPAAALAQTAEDAAGAEAAVEAFNAAFAAEDYTAIIAATPPAVWDHLADQAGVETDMLVVAMAAQMADMMLGIEVDSYEMAFADAQGGVSDADRPYFLIPTETVMGIAGAGRVRSLSDTLVLEDEGAWYLLRVESDAHRRILSQVYPDLAGVDFAPGVQEPVQ